MYVQKIKRLKAKDKRLKAKDKEHTMETVDNTKR